MIFNSNGVGRLSECTRCEVTEERNGIYEVEMELPITARHYAEIEEGMILSLTHDDTHKREPFIIYRRTAPIDGVVTFYAHHISYLLTGVILRPYEAETAAEALAQMPSYSMNTNPFTFWTDKTSRGEFKVVSPSPCRQMLGGVQGSILDVFGGGEYEFTDFTVKLHEARGRDTGVEIRYGKNLTDIENDFDVSGAVGGMVGYWRGTPEGSDEEVTIYSPIVYAQGYADGAPVAVYDFSGEYQTQPTAEELTAKTQTYLATNKPWLPDQNIKVDFVALWQTEEYKNIAVLQRVGLCDTVGVVYPALGVNVRKEVIRVVYDVLRDEYSEIELGTPKTSLVGEIASTFNQAIEALREAMKDQMGSAVKRAVDHATELITGGLGGYVVMTPNADGEPQEILIMDTDDINTAVNVIRINKAGIGFSSTGYNGPFKSAWTIDGHFVADFIDTGNLNAALITTGTMLADRILGGTLKLGGLSDGAMGVYDANDNQIVSIDKNGTWFRYNHNWYTSGHGYVTVGSSGLVPFDGIPFAIYGDAVNQNNTVFRIQNGSGYDRVAQKTLRHIVFDMGNSSYPIDAIYVGSHCVHYKNATNVNEAFHFFSGNAKFGSDVLVSGSVEVSRDVTVSGTKSRVVDTQDYGDRLLYCYEMASPVFGDFGSGETDDDGLCYVEIDDVIRETISDLEYHVFLTKEGQGDIWVDEKGNNYFVVKGTPGLRFAWELKAVQRDYETVRTEVPGIYNTQAEESDLESIYDSDLEDYINMMEDEYNEVA